MISLDEWQKTILDHTGNIVLRSGRQVGKSTVISIKAAEYAASHTKKTILIISSVERQAYFLFEKTLSYLLDTYPKLIRKGKDKPTKSRVRLTNGSMIYSLPTGLDGHGIRGLTVDLLIADEAAFIPEDVWPAITPMLATTKGNIILLSTPHGKQGYFYNCFNNPDFFQTHISSEDCSRVDPEFLKREKERMSNVQYAQEYLGEFVDELRQFFPTEIIQQCMVIGERTPKTDNPKYLGIDIARLGGDETVLLSLERDKDNLYMFGLNVYVQTLITKTIRLIKDVDRKDKYKKIYIDDAGIGAGVYDSLREDEQTKRKIVAINNAKKAADYETSMDTKVHEHKTKLMKEAIYTNLLKLMETKKIKLWQSPEVLLSLKSIQYEYVNEESGRPRIRIFGNYSHITEALVRAAWCIKDKTLNLYIA